MDPEVAATIDSLHNPQHAASPAPQTPEAPAQPTPAAAPAPTAPQTPEAPAQPKAPTRQAEDVIEACNEFSAREWLSVVRELDVNAAVVVSNLPIAAMAVAVVEDARESGFWRWEKYADMDNTALLEALGVDTEAAAQRNPEPYGAATKSD